MLSITPARPRGGRRRALLAAALAAFALPAASQAATVEMSNGVAALDADPGEAGR